MLLEQNGRTMQKYMRHASQNSLIKLYEEKRKQDSIMSLPICPKCERAGLRDKGWADQKIMRCPHCGYSGKATHVMFSYLKESLFK